MRYLLQTLLLLAGIFTAGYAIAAEKEIKDPALLARLEEEIKKLASTSADERLSAARALGQLCDARAIEPLLARLADPDERVRIAAVRSLGKIGEPSVIPELTRCLDRGEIPLILAVIDAFHELESPKATPVLIVLIRHGDEKVRLAALDAIAALPDPSATTIISDYIKTAGPKERVRAAAALGTLDDDRAVLALVGLLEDNASGVRAAAIDALRKIACIEFAFEAEADAIVRAAAVNEIQKWRRKAEKVGREGWLLEGLKDGDDKTRAACARGLFRHGTEKAIPCLIGALDDTLSGVRESAAAALVKISGLDFGYDSSAPEAERKKRIDVWKSWWGKNSGRDRRAWMLDALKDESPGNRRRAADALAKFSDSEVLNALAAALDDSISGVRAAAGQSLKKITGADCGFDADAPNAARAAAAAKWREFIRTYRAPQGE